MKTLQGQLVPQANKRYALVAARFNDVVVSRLIGGAVDVLERHGVPSDHIELIRVPGAWEIPWACQRIAKAGRADALIALGAVVRGSTPHFDYVCSEVAKGVAHVCMQSGIVATFGVLTADTMDQAMDRAGGKVGNKGAEAALAALELLSLDAALGN